MVARTNVKGEKKMLQRRYMVVRDGEEVSVLREHLTHAERVELIEKFRREAAGKAEHAANLRAYTEVRQALDPEWGET